MSEPPAGPPPATVPAGSKDVLAVEAAELRAIEDAWRASVALCGYREVMTPTLEYAEVVDRAQADASTDAYRLFDESGRVLVLRPDLTIPVARLVATRLGDHPGPVRVAYVASAFRPPRPGRPRAAEVRQAGLELVGATEPGADAEVIGLLVRSLRATGVPDPRVSVADVSLTRALMDALGIPDALRGRLGVCLAEHDLVGWAARVAEAVPPGAGADLLAELPALRGDASLLERVAAVVPAAAPACARLREILDLAVRHGADDALTIDLGVLRDWSYYSGVVFEAYAAGAPEPLAMGGRYDGVAAAFGRPRPAVGFAVALDQLHRALVETRPPAASLRDGTVLVGGLDECPDAAADARRRGVVVVALARGDDGRADALAAADGWRFVARARDGGFDVLDRATGAREWWERLWPPTGRRAVG